MVERVGLAAESARTMSQVAPRLLILAGATGVGKSTAARQIAAASGFSRIISTDAIREIMRTCIDVDEDPALHRSSFSRGENGEAVIDWQRTCEAVEHGITATIERARREGIDLLIEGVDLAVTGLVRVIDPCGLGARCTAAGGKTCNQSDTHKGAQRCGEGRGLKHGINPENA